MRRFIAFFLFLPTTAMTSCIFTNADFSAYTCTVEAQFSDAEFDQLDFGVETFIGGMYPLTRSKASEADFRRWSEAFWAANPGLRIEQETYRVDGVITGSAYKANQDSYQIPVPCE